MEGCVGWRGLHGVGKGDAWSEGAVGVYGEMAVGMNKGREEVEHARRVP